MTMRVYKSTDASAPTLQGIVGGAYSSGWADGSLVQLLNQVLVNGYGSKTAAGWTLSFHGTSEGTFRQGGGCQFYLHVLDDGSLTAGAKEASFYGAEVMTALATGTGLFPTAAQQSTGLKIRKSDTASSQVRQWIMFADNKTWYLFVWAGGLAGDTQTISYYSASAFGDFYSYVSGDAYNCMAIGRATSASTDTAPNDVTASINADTTSALTGHYIARGYTQLGTAVQFQKIGNFISVTSSVGDVAANGLLPYPNPCDNKLWLSRVYITDPTTVPTNGVRGFLRGFWNSQAAGTALPMEYTLNGSGGLSGRTFKVLGLRTSGSSSGRFVMETSDTWD